MDAKASRFTHKWKKNEVGDSASMQHNHQPKLSDKYGGLDSVGC
jgi:hypothetical protein